MTGSISRFLQIFCSVMTIIYPAACASFDTPIQAWVVILLGLGMLGVTVSSHLDEYEAGIIEVEHFPDGSKRYSLNLEEQPEDWNTRKKIVFHIEDTQD